MSILVRAIASFLADFSGYFCILPLLILIFKQKPYNRFQYALVLILFVYSFFNVLSIYVSHSGGNNLFTTHLFTFIELPLWGWFFGIVFRQHKLFRAFIFWSVITGASFAIINTAFFQPLTRFNSNARTLVSVLEICYCLMYLLMYSELQLFSAFRIAATLMLYNASSILLFAFSNYLLKQSLTLNYIVWSFHNLLLMGVFIAIFLDSYLYKEV